MGLCFEAIEAIAFLKRTGKLADVRSMVELGNQHVRYQRADVAALLTQFGVRQDSDQTTAMFYKSWGVGDYTAIDLNGEDGALEFDLNTPFTSNGSFQKTFDFVTNFGTTEHCFNQAVAFENIHNLTSVGGYMAHTLPSHGWNGHCFYRYDGNFFHDLAYKCGYEIVFLKYYARPITWKRYFKMITRNFPLRSRHNAKNNFDRAFSRDVLVTVVFRKTDKHFSYPIQGMYSELEEKVS